MDAIENGPVEIVDLPIKNGGLSHRFLYVYQRVWIEWDFQGILITTSNVNPG